MRIQIALPDELVSFLEAKWGSLERKLVKIIVVEAYCEGLISLGKARKLLSIKTRLEVDAFLKAKGVNLPYSEADFEAALQTHEQL